MTQGHTRTRRASLAARSVHRDTSVTTPSHPSYCSTTPFVPKVRFHNIIIGLLTKISFLLKHLIFNTFRLKQCYILVLQKVGKCPKQHKDEVDLLPEIS